MLKEITILGIDTSCDDTGVALLQIKNPKSKIQKVNVKILSNVVSSQVKLHAKYGGVYPALAKREHQRNLVPVLTQAIRESKLLKITNSKSQILNSKLQTLKEILKREGELAEKLIQFLKKYEKPKLDAIAVTVGPGLEPCLWQGINFAKALAYYWKIPVIAVNHIEAHLFANFLPNQQECKELNSLHSSARSSTPCKFPFPAMGLVVSGGHTELILIEKVGKYQIIGETLDDAAGECFDKTARILGLGYPGGPAIAAEAALWKSQIQNPKSQINSKLKIQNPKQEKQIQLPRPMINSKDFNFSFSGLKTAALYNFKSQTPAIQKSKQYKTAMAHEIQQAIIDVLIKKTFKACQAFGVKNIILGGGVAANKELRKQFDQKPTMNNQKINFLVPIPALCADNGAMVAMTGAFHLNQFTPWQKLVAKGNLKI